MDLSLWQLSSHSKQLKAKAEFTEVTVVKSLRSHVDLWRLLVLPFFVQLEIRVRLQREYCRYKAMLNAYGEVARGSVDLWS